MLHPLLIAAAIAIVAFAGVWALSVRVRNYGFLDVAWSYAVAVLAPLYAWLGPGDPVRKWMFTGIGTLWSLRLGSYILRRVLRHHPKEDPRYEKLRRRWHGPGLFLLFFELQAVIAVIFSLPFLFVSFNENSGLTPLEIGAFALAVIAWLGEATADAQMQAFKHDPAHRDEVCRRGLWRYSRHPNYFFELLTWCAYFLFACGSPHGVWTVCCPILMWYFLFRVTGIPLTEEYSLRSKGEKYREYQRTTSQFIPWFPKA